MAGDVESAQTRGLLGLGTVLVLLIAALAIQGEPEVEVDAESTAPVWSVDAELITAMRIERADGVVRLEREGETWWMVEPTRSRADPDRVRALLQLTEVERGVPVPNPADPEEYGLGDPPRVRWTVSLQGDVERTLDIGVAAPVGYRTYARGADGTIVAIAGDAERLFGEPIEVFRDHRMFDADPALVRAVTLWSPEGRLRLEGAGTEWRLVGYGRADPAQVDDVVMGLLDLRYDVIWDRAERVEEAAYGAALELADGSVHELRVGDVTPMGAVSSTSDGRFGTLYAEQLKQISRGPTSIADPRAFAIDLEAADEVRVELDGVSRTALRNGPSWTSEGLRPDRVYRGVAALSEVPVTYRHDPPQVPTTTRGQVVTRSSDQLHVVLLRDVVDDHWIVTDAALDVSYRVPRAAFDAAMEEWR